MKIKIIKDTGRGASIVDLIGKTFETCAILDDGSVYVKGVWGDATPTAFWPGEWEEVLETPAPVEPSKSTNPKDILGRKKPCLYLVPSVATIWTAKAMEDGAKKYGPYNWRDKKVLATVYLDAAMRHIKSYLDGEECAEDSGHPHLAHASACLAILMDAKENGCLIDDRPLAGKAADLIKRLTQKS